MFLRDPQRIYYPKPSPILTYSRQSLPPVTKMAPPTTKDAAPVVKKANQKVSDKKPCGLLYLEDNKVVVLGGRGIGYTSQVQTELVWAARHSNISSSGYVCSSPEPTRSALSSTPMWI